MNIPHTLACAMSLGIMTTMSFAQLTPSSSPNPITTTTPPPSKEKTPKEEKPKVATIGKAAPNFALMDTKGKSHQLTDFAGKFVVIEWFNPGCPYCRAIYVEGVVEDTIEKTKQIDSDAVYLAINSTANQPKEFVITQSDEFLGKHEMEQLSVLIDYDGTVGKLYGAKTTPHMFVIDPKGVLIYAGAITDDQNFDKGEAATNYVVDAVRASVSEGRTPPAAVRPWGCRVKYADGGGTRGRRGKRGGGRPASP